ncbi:Uncharacterised protein [Vibrio cholerae]|nr:Uncharacterised protein [Vibrio cholerae]
MSKITSSVFCVSFVVLRNRCPNAGTSPKNGTFDTWSTVFDFIKPPITTTSPSFARITESDSLIELLANGSSISSLRYKIFLVCCSTSITAGCTCSNTLP